MNIPFLACTRCAEPFRMEKVGVYLIECNAVGEPGAVWCADLYKCRCGNRILVPGQKPFAERHEAVEFEKFLSAAKALEASGQIFKVFRIVNP